MPLPPTFRTLAKRKRARDLRTLRLRLISTLAACLCVATTSTGAAQGPFEVLRYDSVWVPMRDGAKMYAEVYRPARRGVAIDTALPVLLLRTPYEIRGDEIVRQARAFVGAGYVVALQNIRGRYLSEGTFSKYSTLDAPDGYDTIEWLAARPFSNGRVGTWGRSYAAHAQADAAKLNPPHLRTMIVNQGGMANAWDHAVRHGGAFELGREMTWAWQEARRETTDSVARALLDREKVETWYERLPLRPGLSPLSAVPEYEKYFLDEWRNENFNAFWQKSSLNWKGSYARTANVPMVHLGGWYDIFLRGTLENYVALSRLKSAPVRLIVGPWVHGGTMRTYAGDVDFGAEAAFVGFEDDFHIQWFDHFLKGKPNAVAQQAPVKIFVMGGGDGRKDSAGRLRHGGQWRTAPTWPIPGASPTRFFLHPDGSLQTRPPEITSVTRFTFDPSQPVPTLGGHVSNRVKDGAYNQRERPDFAGSRPPYLPLRARRDVVTFQTAPLTDDVEIIGPIEVRLQVSTTGFDTDFTAKLVDVYPPSADFPDGFDLNITDALQRLSFRADSPRRLPVEPGRPYVLTIRPFSTANCFQKGHRIRIDISSSNFPRFDVNPNTGESPATARTWRVVENAIVTGGPVPSYVTLPVVRR